MTAIQMLLNSEKGARLCLMEALTNLCMVPVTSLEDVKVSGNWMWPAKLPGEGAALWDACGAFCNLLKDLHIAIDGGKDSLSMAATVNKTTVVKSPGSLVVSTYVSCPDVRLVVTPDLKGNGTLIWIRVSGFLFSLFPIGNDHQDEQRLQTWRDGLGSDLCSVRRRLSRFQQHCTFPKILAVFTRFIYEKIGVGRPRY